MDKATGNASYQVVYNGLITMPGEEFNLPGVIPASDNPNEENCLYPTWYVSRYDGTTDYLWLSVKDDQMWISPLHKLGDDEWDAPQEEAYWIDRQGAVVSEVFFVDGRVIDLLLTYWTAIEDRIAKCDF